jgi:hypothetical protein
MTTFKNALLSAVLLSAAALAGCGGYGYYRSGYVPPPPPAPYGGVLGYAPGPGYVWTDGFYDLRGGRWFWVQGGWVRPPRPHAVYMRPYWAPYRRGYRFHRGYWRH